MGYSIEDIIEASLKGEKVQNNETHSSKDTELFKIRTSAGSRLRLKDASKIKSFLNAVEKKCDVKLDCVGGGYGCTEFEFRVTGEKKAKSVVSEILSDPELLKKAQEAGIKFIITVSDNLRLEIEKATLQDSHESNSQKDNGELPKFSKSGREIRPTGTDE